MTRKLRIPTAAVAAALVAAVVVAGCAHAANDATAPTTAPTVTATATATSTPTATAPPAATTAVAPVAGATVPAAQVDAARATGAHVYVSPNGTGDGLVVDPTAPLPAVVVADAHAASPNVKWTDGTKTAADFSASQKATKAWMNAAQAAGIKAFIVATWPQSIEGNTLSGTTSYIVATDGAMPDAVAWITAHGGTPAGATQQAALDAAKALFAAFPGVPVITLG